MTEPTPERRSGKRISARVPVAVRAVPGSPKAEGYTRDLSSSGMFLYTQSKLAPGSEIEMLLILPPELTAGERRWVCCQASVVRVEEVSGGGEFGVAARLNSITTVPEIPD